MREYFVAIITVSIICGVARSLMPSFSRILSSVFRVALVAMIVYPFSRALIDEADKYKNDVIFGEEVHIIDNREAESITSRLLAKNTASALEESIEKGIRNDVGVEVNARIVWHLADGDVVFDRVEILSEHTDKTREAIVTYVGENYFFDVVFGR